MSAPTAASCGSTRRGTVRVRALVAARLDPSARPARSAGDAATRSRTGTSNARASATGPRRAGRARRQWTAWPRDGTSSPTASVRELELRRLTDRAQQLDRAPDPALVAHQPDLRRRRRPARARVTRQRRVVPEVGRSAVVPEVAADRGAGTRRRGRRLRARAPGLSAASRRNERDGRISLTAQEASAGDRDKPGWNSRSGIKTRGKAFASMTASLAMIPLRLSK